jgi:hypothetical protein
MYSWGDEMEDWARPGTYKFDDARKAARDKDAVAAKAAGPRTYQHGKSAPDVGLTDPRKNISTQSPNPLVVAIDVTGSMQTWPFEIFDRLPLVYQTLSQYRADLELTFAAIGDAGCDRYPLQVTDFASGFGLESRMKALYGEGGGGDAPESYGLFAYYMLHHARLPELEEQPFLILFADAPMHKKVPAAQIKHFLGDPEAKDADAVECWQELSKLWNIWFLRRPGGKKGDDVDRQWAQAIGAQKIVHMTDEKRAVDYALGLIARSWGQFGDFKQNIRARQTDSVADAVENSILAIQEPTIKRGDDRKAPPKEPAPAAAGDSRLTSGDWSVKEDSKPE